MRNHNEGQAIGQPIANEPDAPQVTEVELLKSHTHEGEAKEKGDKISVDDATAAWLRKHEVIA